MTTRGRPTRPAGRGRCAPSWPRPVRVGSCSRSGATRTWRSRGRSSRRCDRTGSRPTPRCKRVAYSCGRRSGSSPSSPAPAQHFGRAEHDPEATQGCGTGGRRRAVPDPYPALGRWNRSRCRGGAIRCGRGRRRRTGPPMTVPTLDATGKTVVVTGASKGLGRAMALGFAEAGADVVVASRNVAACEIVADEIESFGASGVAASMSCRRLGRVRRADRRIRRRVRPDRRARQQRRHRSGSAFDARGDPRAVRQDDRRQLEGSAATHRPRRRAHARRREHHQHQLDRRASCHTTHRGLLRRESRV